MRSQHFLRFKNLTALNFLNRRMGSSLTNRLANEKSPYLLQHKNNPVDWYPWGDEAFRKAKDLNRPIFLSIGYSTCHWCHVMEHESFENESIAKFLNEKFISIKVDREERPDVDKYYMSFVQAMSGHGGWPLSVWMTPDKEPFLGGTYFPPEDSPHQTGFRSVLKLVSSKWNEDPQNTKEHAEYLVKVLKEAFKPKEFEGEIVARDSVLKCFKTLQSSFDEENGGFSVAPKFPEPSNLLFLAQYCALHSKDDTADVALKMLCYTLDKLASGGIHDFIGGGFHRYSVDQHWHVPHFEKMLYDQAQLLSVYSQAQMLGKDYRSVIEDIVFYVKECLTSNQGAFYCAEDADSLPTAESTKKVEGSFYVWTNNEIDDILGDFAPAGNENITLNELFSTTYSIQQNGNVPRRIDAHGELTGKNVLLQSKSLDELAREFKMSVTSFQKALRDCYEELKKVRNKRPRPHLDNKILNSWNSLMISGLVQASRALPEHKDEYSSIAEKAFKFISKHLRREDGSLVRSAYVDEHGDVTKSGTEIDGYADDYACFIQACIDLYEIRFDEQYLKMALDSQKVFHEKFFDHEDTTGYFYSSSDSSETFVRSKPEQDGAEPNPNSVAALNCIRLGEILNQSEFKETATKIIHGAGTLITRSPHAIPLMTTALERLQGSSVQIIVAGNDENEKQCREMLDTINLRFIPNRILMYVNNSRKDGLICSKNAHVRDIVSSISSATAMVCSNYSCSLPATNVEELNERLNDL